MPKDTNHDLAGDIADFLDWLTKLALATTVVVGIGIIVRILFGES